MCSSVGRAAVSKAAGRGFESLRTRSLIKEVVATTSNNAEVIVAVELKTMEVKKVQQVAAPAARPIAKDVPFSGGRARDFFADVKAELFKINWTSYEELKTYTQIVCGATLAFGMGIYFVDLLIQMFLGGLSLAIRLIFG